MIMGTKALYNDTKEKILEQLRLAGDIAGMQKIQKDREAYLKYADKWERVNLDEYIERFKIQDEKFNMSHNLRKISFWDDGKQYEIVAAVGASYFRIVRKAYYDQSGRKHGDVYVTLDLKEPRVSGALRGKEAVAERNRLTHFRMTYKKKGDKQ